MGAKNFSPSQKTAKEENSKETIFRENRMLIFFSPSIHKVLKKLWQHQRNEIMYEFARAAIKNTTDWGAETVSLLWRLEVQDQGGREGLISSEGSLFSLQTATFSLCPHMVFPLWVWTSVNPLYVQTSSYKDTSQTGLGSTHMTSF